MLEGRTGQFTQTKKYPAKYNLLLIFSILLPLTFLIFTAFIHEKQRLFNFLNLKQSSLVDQVQSTLQALQKHIENSKINIKYQYKQQISIDEDVDTKQKEKKVNFNKDFSKLQQSQLKYFQSIQNYSSNRHQNHNQIILDLFYHSELKEIKLIQQLSGQKKEKSWLQIADKIVFSVTLLGINHKSSPLSDQSADSLEQQVKNQLKLDSYLKQVVVNKKSSQQISLNKNLQIDVILKSAHISQVDQNNRKKLQTMFNNQKSLAQKNQNTNQQIDFYVQEIFKELQVTNKGNECKYERNHTKCKQFRVYLLYDSLHELNQICKFLNNQNVSIGQESSEQLMSIKVLINERVSNIGYWSRQDNSMTLITFHPFIREQQAGINPQKPLSHDLDQINQKMFFSLLKQVIYSNIGIAPLILLTRDMWCQEQSNFDKSLKIQKLINQYMQLNLLYKTKSTLQHIHRILNAQSPIYEQIPQKTIKSILNLTDSIKNYSPWSQILLNNQILISNPTTSPMTNSIRHLDPFPSDYILGTLLPITIILIYPLFGLLKKILF